MFGPIGGVEIMVIVLVILLFFGAKRIPELARGIGQGINEFRKASDEIKKEIKEGEKEGYASGAGEKENTVEGKKE